MPDFYKKSGILFDAIALLTVVSMSYTASQLIALQSGLLSACGEGLGAG